MWDLVDSQHTHTMRFANKFDKLYFKVPAYMSDLMAHDSSSGIVENMQMTFFIIMIVFVYANTRYTL